MDYWQKRKLRNWIIIGVLVLAAVLGIRELLRVHANSVTIKYVEDIEAYQSSKRYTWAVSSSDQEVVEEWVSLMEEIRKKGDKVKPGVLDQPYPCYIVEFRLKKGPWVALMQVTENRIGCAYQILGGNVYEFGSDNPFFEQTGEMAAKLEAAEN